jgi:hypothetical protein
MMESTTAVTAYSGFRSGKVKESDERKIHPNRKKRPYFLKTTKMKREGKRPKKRPYAFACPD